MTANELADKLDEYGTYLNELAATMLRQQQDKLTKYELRHAEQRKRIDELETMLRQQQAEIEALKAVIRLNDETLKPMLIEQIKSNQQKDQQEVFFNRYDSIRGTKEKK